MARGWESKAVEDQIGAAEASRDLHAKPQLSKKEREKQIRRESLMLSRAQIIGRLKGVTNTRYRAQLEKTLQHLDEQLREEGETK
jgi:predicted Holliday junction resolvase-like endonuclease